MTISRSPSPRLVLPVLLVGLAGSAPAAAQELQVDLDRLEHVADSVALHHIASDVTPGMTVAVARDGEILFQEGYGVADAEMGVAATPATVYRIGSITKQFTAAAVMELVDRGRLSVSDSIGRFFDEVPPDKRGITIHHLLTHTSGLDAVTAGDFDFLAREEIVERAMASELLWEPGTRYRYSNLGYSLAGAIVEVATGEDYERWLRDNLFRPSGMFETGYLLPEYEPVRVATGYRGSERWGTVIERLSPDLGPSWVLRANGGIHTTLHDMHRWVQAVGVMDADDGEQRGSGRAAGSARAHLLSRESRERMFAPHADEGFGSYYGYGWVVDTTARGTPIVWHDGGNGILHADLRIFPAEGVETFMMTSTADLPATDLLSQVNAVLFGEEVAMPPAVEAVSVPPDELGALTGTYRLDGGGMLEVRSIGSGLVVHSYGQEAVDALWRGEPSGSVDYAELNRSAVRFARAFGRGDYAGMRALMGPDTPEEPYRDVRERMLGTLGPLEEVQALGTVPAWFHEGSSEATWLRLRFERRTTVRRVHWSADGTVVGLGGMVYPSPVSLRCAMTGADRCVGWHEGLEIGEPRLTFRLEGPDGPRLTVLRSDGRRISGRRIEP